jgi:hypothetical protein
MWRVVVYIYLPASLIIGVIFMRDGKSTPWVFRTCVARPWRRATDRVEVIKETLAKGFSVVGGYIAADAIICNATSCSICS